jgi:hypothetical protein
MMHAKDGRQLAGVDIFVEASFDAKFPSQVGPLKLLHRASRGTKLTGHALEKTILDVGWLSVRYVFESPISMTAPSDAAIGQLIEEIGANFNWSSVIKLYSHEGKPLYS